jgi:hypothetical protein
MVCVKRNMKKDIIYILSLNQIGMEREKEEEGGERKKKKTERKRSEKKCIMYLKLIIIF